MENYQIKIWLNGKYINVNYDTFIDSFVKTYFFVKDIRCIEKFLFEVLKIEDKDKQIIINSFKEECLKFEDYLIKNKQEDNYFDKLCNYLFHSNFQLLDRKHMDLVLNNLQVSDFNRNKILQIFTKN